MALSLHRTTTLVTTRLVTAFGRIGLLATCAFAAALALSAAPARAGCNSGNVGTPDLLTSANCQATANSADGTAVGVSAFAEFGGTAFGFDATASGGVSTAVGNKASAGAENATAVGRSAGASAAGATSVGNFAGFNGAGLYSTAIGAGTTGFSGARAHGNMSIAIGGGNGTGGSVGALATGIFSIAIGSSAVATGLRTVAVGPFAGTDAAAGNHRNSSFGSEAGRFVTGAGNTAAGLAAGHTVSGDLNSSLGNSAGQFVTGNNNLAGGILAGTTVNGSFNAAFGDNAGRDVNGSSNVAIGDGAGRNVNVSHTVAVGTIARATALNAVAIGRGATATKPRAVAIGHGAVADVADTFSVGSAALQRRIVNVAAAVKPTDAVNLAQLQAATLAPAATPASTGNADMRQELTTLRALVQRLEARIAQLEGRNVATAPAGN